ncbi:hypothetical protein [Nonomuraea sp. NPDC050783]|uniref:hypothetical protein n=1 Tax=Nonomuraea sp. NPDC050783 TaxID=3154634 RepID=UPI00346731D7
MPPRAPQPHPGHPAGPGAHPGPQPPGAHPGPQPPGAGFPQGPPPGRGRPYHPDQQVWPPAAHRPPRGSSTQPIPVVPGAPAAQPWPPQPPRQPQPQSPHQTQHQTQHQTPPPPPGAPPAAGPGEGGPATAPRSGRRRLLLVGAGAVVVSLLTAGLRTYDGHAFYQQQITRGLNLKETVVPAGQAGRAYNIEWRAAIAPTKPPEGNKHGPEVTWLRIDITKKVVDASSTTMTAEPNNVKLQDRAGREWTVPIQPVGDRPTDKLVVGKDYKIMGLAIVPTPVADEVELSFRPSDYRSDTPTKDLFNREKMEQMGVDVVVLRFRRR